MKTVNKNSQEAQENLRRQQILKLAGYNVPQDGSWGPYQQKLWEQINTKEKQYTPSVWGLLERGYDTVTGNTTYVDNGYQLKEGSGEPTENVDKYRRNEEYFHWWHGAPERWKASINNNTNPLIGLGRTFVPAILGGSSSSLCSDSGKCYYNKNSYYSKSLNKTP